MVKNESMLRINESFEQLTYSINTVHHLQLQCQLSTNNQRIDYMVKNESMLRINESFEQLIYSTTTVHHLQLQCQLSTNIFLYPPPPFLQNDDLQMKRKSIQKVIKEIGKYLL